MLIRVENCGECPANTGSTRTIDKCAIGDKSIVGTIVFKKIGYPPPTIPPSWCPLRSLEAGNILCGDCSIKIPLRTLEVKEDKDEPLPNPIR